MLFIEASEGDVVGRVHHYRDDMPLTNAHKCLQIIPLLLEQFCLKHLRRKVLWIRADVPHQSFKIRNLGPSNKRSTAPVVEQCSGQGSTGERRDWFNDQLSLLQEFFILRSQGRRQKVISGLVLPSEPRLNGFYIGVESGNGFRRGFSDRAGRSSSKGQQPNEKQEKFGIVGFAVFSSVFNFSCFSSVDVSGIRTVPVHRAIRSDEHFADLG